MLHTVTIGIAAFNEANNIRALLDALLRQNTETFQLEMILVVSDASTDDTDSIVKEFEHHHNVVLYRMPERSGANQVQNTIMEKNESDILVVLDADIIPEDEHFIAELVAPLIQNQAVALTSAEILPVPPRTFVEKVLARNHLWKTELFRQRTRQDTVYMCFGPARAFSRDMMTMRYTLSVPVDAYSYFWCKKIGKQFVSVRRSRALFRCPNNLSDHFKQSRRFQVGRQSIISIFGKDAEDAYSLPKGEMLPALIREACVHPILFLSFLVVSFMANSKQATTFQSKWDMAESSKKVL